MRRAGLAWNIIEPQHLPLRPTLERVSSPNPDSRQTLKRRMI
jgi:hypothetical protein